MIYEKIMYWGNYEVPQGWPTNVRFNAPGDVPGTPVMFDHNNDTATFAGLGFESDATLEGDLYFYHADHLGSTTYTTDTAGHVSQFLCYTPYGESLVDEHVGSYESPFKFTAKEQDTHTGLYDHGARHRNPATTLWYGVDELFEKYPEVGAYVYCGGNPVRLVDPDGRIVVFAKGVSEKFRKDFGTAIKYLNEKGCGAIFKQLQESKEIVYIDELPKEKRAKGSYYTARTKTIYWDSESALKTDEDKIISPTSILNHEADHALADVSNRKSFIENAKKKSDEQYDTKEERRVITGSEQITARKLGEINVDEVTRKNHKGFLFITNSPTSTEEVNMYLLEEIVVTPKK